jgi:hypothetical protein
MLKMKITDIHSNGFFLSSSNRLQKDDSLINLFWVFLSMGIITVFGLPNILPFILFILSTKVLSNLNTYILTKEQKINLLLNLVKFWSFSYLVCQILRSFDYFFNNCIINIGLDVLTSFYLVKYSYDWFKNNNMIVTDKDKSTELEGSVNIVDKVLSKVTVLYNINKLSLNFVLNGFIYIIDKTKNWFKLSDKSSEITKENLIEKEPTDNTNYEPLIDKIVKENVVNNNLDTIDEEDFSLTKK